MIYNNLEKLRIFAYFETNVELLKNKVLPLFSLVRHIFRRGHIQKEAEFRYIFVFSTNQIWFFRFSRW